MCRRHEFEGRRRRFGVLAAIGAPAVGPAGAGPAGSARPRPRAWAARLVVALACLTLLPIAAPAEAGVIDRVKETGVLRAGTRADAMPFGVRSEDGQLVGFAVDLLEEIRKALEKRVERPVRLDLTAVTAADRLEKLESGQIDIECGITTPTWNREDRIDFSIPFFRDGTRILAYRDTVKQKPDIAKMTIGVAAGTTTPDILRSTLPTAAIKEYPDMTAAMSAMAKGEVDGIANIGVVLLGLSHESEPRRSIVLLPRTESLGTEAMACGLPQNDSPWRDLVNRALVDLMQGIGEFRGRYVELHDRWFGRRDLMVYPLDRATRDYLGDMNIWAR
jgi:polar amino acid transport system substrate-binding protein